MAAILFDMDGVLIDSEIVYLGFICDFLLSKNVTCELTQLYPIVGSTLEKTYELIASHLPQPNEITWVAQEYERFVETRAVDYSQIMFPGVIEVLDHVRAKGHKMGLASSSRMDNIQHVLDVCGLNDYFDVVVSGDQFHQSKPHPEIYQFTANQLNVSPYDCIVIEDSVYGIQAAKSAGMKVIAIRDLRFSTDTSLADHVVDSLPEVLSFIS